MISWEGVVLQTKVKPQTKANQRDGSFGLLEMY